MAKVYIYYYEEKNKSRSESWFRLSSENRDYNHEGKLRKGNEDYNALFIFLNSMPNQSFELSIEGRDLSLDKFESLDELLKSHNVFFNP